MSYLGKKLGGAPTSPAGMAMGLVLTSCWSDTFAPSGAKAAYVPVRGEVAATQPQPPGAQVGTAELKAPRVPLSKPSLNGCVALQGVEAGVAVGTPVGVTVAVRVAVRVRVTVAVSAGVRVLVAVDVALGVLVGVLLAGTGVSVLVDVPVGVPVGTT